ncbi:MAG TPA: GatB/YqeY domain-containing protein, partial [Thermoanaerobaculia bacterium]|nr:GatB/YqeY domain-containing protein [Thermoanaerobaculia bacterium]
LSDEEAMTVIRKAMKQRQDSIEQFTNAGRTEMAEKERSEMELLKAYLPAELTPEELESGVREIITSTGAQSKKDLGKVMKEATARFKGRVDGKKVQEVVSRLLP